MPSVSHLCHSPQKSLSSVPSAAVGQVAAGRPQEDRGAGSDGWMGGCKDGQTEGWEGERQPGGVRCSQGKGRGPVGVTRAPLRRRGPPRSLGARAADEQHRVPAARPAMPNFAGTWKMRSSENFDELLKALGVNAMLRKVAVAAASKPHVEIRQDGDQFYIKTSTTVRTTEINFKIGESFEEETVDGRKCRSLATWENENKIYCKQTLIEGDGPKTYWTRELANDELILHQL
uniref:Cellular retinoic acid binding protein 1 n=1 Tax=Gallus gallus TaxID=9031 RepID=A0A8V1A0I8_CHICK